MLTPGGDSTATRAGPDPRGSANGRRHHSRSGLTTRTGSAHGRGAATGHSEAIASPSACAVVGGGVTRPDHDPRDPPHRPRSEWSAAERSLTAHAVTRRGHPGPARSCPAHLVSPGTPCGVSPGTPCGFVMPCAGRTSERPLPPEHRAPVGMEHHMIPGEPQHEPAPHRQFVVAPAVPLEVSAPAVKLEAVRFDHDSQTLIDAIGTAPQPVVGDGQLGPQPQAGNIQGDRAERRLERIRGPAVRLPCHPCRGDAAPGNPVTRQPQLVDLDQAIPQGRVGHGQRRIERQRDRAVDKQCAEAW